MLTKELQTKIDHMNFCTFCGAPVAHGRGYKVVGMCSVHLKIWEEDIEFGLYRRNRLKELQNKINENKNGNQLLIEFTT